MVLWLFWHGRFCLFAGFALIFYLMFYIKVKKLYCLILDVFWLLLGTSFFAVFLLLKNINYILTWLHYYHFLFKDQLKFSFLYKVIHIYPVKINLSWHWTTVPIYLSNSINTLHIFLLLLLYAYLTILVQSKC